MSDVLKMEDINFMLAISAAHAYQLLMNAKRVGAARGKYKVMPPNMEGPPELQRTMRVQVDDLEFGIPFEILFWTCGLSTHQGLACTIGLTYLYARHIYRKGYIEEAEKRWPGHRLAVRCMVTLLYTVAAGVTNQLSKQVLGYDIFGLAKDFVLGLVKGNETEL